MPIDTRKERKREEAYRAIWAIAAELRAAVRQIIPEIEG